MTVAVRTPEQQADDLRDAVLSARDYLRTMEREPEQPVWWYANRFPRMCETVLLLATPNSQKEEGVVSGRIGGRYVLGNPRTRFALFVYQYWTWRLPWQRPRGGWLVGRLGLWWSK